MHMTGLPIHLHTLLLSAGACRPLPGRCGPVWVRWRTSAATLSSSPTPARAWRTQQTSSRCAGRLSPHTAHMVPHDVCAARSISAPGWPAHVTCKRTNLYGMCCRDVLVLQSLLQVEVLAACLRGMPGRLFSLKLARVLAVSSLLPWVTRLQRLSAVRVLQINMHPRCSSHTSAVAACCAQGMVITLLPLAQHLFADSSLHLTNCIPVCCCLLRPAGHRCWLAQRDV